MELRILPGNKILNHWLMMFLPTIWNEFSSAPSLSMLFSPEYGFRSKGD